MLLGDVPLDQLSTALLLTRKIFTTLDAAAAALIATHVIRL